MPIESIPDDSVDIEAAIVQAESAYLMREQIARLKPKFRILLESRLDHELTLAELSSQHGLSVSATKSRLLRARRLLRGASFGVVSKLYADEGSMTITRKA